MAAVPFLWSGFMGVSLVFMLVYIWGREFPNAQVSIYVRKCAVINTTETFLYMQDSLS